MKFLLTAVVSFIIVNNSFCQKPVEVYFNKIRNNTAELTAFFSQMPKGGDLHHHFSGSIYAEPMLQYAIKNDFWLNTETMAVAKTKPQNAGNEWKRFSEIKALGQLEQFKDKVLEKWSVKNYNHVDYPSYRLFFESFDKFWASAAETVPQGMQELKQRAIKENVSYIETQFLYIPLNINANSNYNNLLRQSASNEKALFQLFDSLYADYSKQGIRQAALDFNKKVIEHLHDSLAIDDSVFTMRYLNFSLRFMEPVDVFRDLTASFISSDNSKLAVGVNIVAPEHGETALKDYHLHMLMFKYLHQRFPNVKYSMHAGELAMGLVLPEDLVWHINEAVFTAGAKRIGHGVDLPYEKEVYSLLRYMAANKIAVEINLGSNEFILGVKEDKHPIMLYKKFGVPIVISTDDAGVLRTNMAEQYVLLAKRYKDISYSDIKTFVYNSIRYSFIKDNSLKQKLIQDLDKRFKKFEAMFPPVK